MPGFRGYFRVKRDTPSALWLKLLQMNRLWANRTSLLLWRMAQMMAAPRSRHQLGEVPELGSLGCG